MSSFFSCNSQKDAGGNPPINIEAIIKGCYNLPQYDSRLYYDSTYYFLTEVKITNSSEKNVEFLTFSCTTPGNVVFEAPFAIIDINNCSNNHMRKINLGPKQEFSLPFIFQVSKRYLQRSISIGWIFLNPTEVDPANELKIFDESRKKLKNIVWGPSIKLDPSSGSPYVIE